MTTNGMGTRPLPDGWTWTKLSEACHIELGQSPPSSTYNAEGIGLPFFQGKAEFGNLYPTPVKWCSVPQKIAEAGDVLISVRAPVGSTNLNPEKSCIGRGLAAIRPNDGMSNRYFLYLLRHIEQELIDQATGTTFQAISGRVLREQRIPLAPIPEQERIVAEIEKQFTRLDQAVVSLRRLQTNLSRYKASVLKAACEGRLVPQDPTDEPASKLLQRILTERGRQWQTAHPGKKYPEPTSVDTSNLPNLPESWVWARAEQICDFITKGTTPNASKLFSSTGEIPFIKVYNLTFGGSLDFSVNPTFVSKETHNGELSRSRVFPGDVLMNIVGPPLGKVSIVPDFYREWNMNQAVAVFRPIQGYSNRFLALLLMSETILQWATRRAKATAGQFNLTLEICRDLPLPIPPLAEQHRIVAEVERRLSVITATEQAITTNLARAERLRQSILHRAFTGQLVPQNPTDEPASSLFARIREQAERLKSTLQEQAALEKQSIRKKPSQVKSLSQTKLVAQPMKRTSLFETLLTSARQMKVESLFDQSGFTHEIVDEFYRELRDEVIIQKRIEVIRSDEDEIFVRVIPNAN